MCNSFVLVYLAYGLKQVLNGYFSLPGKEPARKFKKKIFFFFFLEKMILRQIQIFLEVLCSAHKIKSQYFVEIFDY